MVYIPSETVFHARSMQGVGGVSATCSRVYASHHYEEFSKTWRGSCQAFSTPNGIDDAPRQPRHHYLWCPMCALPLSILSISPGWSSPSLHQRASPAYALHDRWLRKRDGDKPIDQDGLCVQALVMR